MRQLVYITFSLFSIFLLSCTEENKVEAPKVKRVFPGYHYLLDEILLTQDSLFRGLELNSNQALIEKTEKSTPKENAAGRLYYEYQADSITNYSIEYTLRGDSLQEISVQISSDDLELANYLFCDLKDYYANKLPNPIEDKGYVVYNCFEGQRKPFVVTLSDNSSPSKGIINMLIYKDQ